MSKKVAVLGDLHFDIFSGLKQERMYDYQEKFFNDVFFPYLLKHNIEAVVQLGDAFDVRTRVSQRSLAFSKRVFFDRLRDEGIVLYMLVGNHDIFYKDSLKIVTAEQVLGEYTNIKLIKSPTTRNIHGKSYSFIPWICKENEDEIKRFIKTDKSTVAFGHLEIAGARLNKYSVMEHGTDVKLVRPYDKVYSGHYHSKSNYGNVEYVGTPYELTKIDGGEQKSFMIIEDGKDDIIVVNPKVLYEQISVFDSNDLTGLLERDLDNKYVEVIVEYQETSERLLKSANALNEKFNMYDFNQVTRQEITETELLTVDTTNIKSNEELISAYADKNELDKRIKTKLLSIHRQALNMENGNELDN